MMLLLVNDMFLFENDMFRFGNVGSATAWGPLPYEVRDRMGSRPHEVRDPMGSAIS